MTRTPKRNPNDSNANPRPSKIGKREAVGLGIRLDTCGGEKRQIRLSFLTLPGELRNTIYEYMLAQDDKTHVSLYYDPSGRRRTLRGARRTAEKSGRQYFALTQACRLIRSEFRPLWLATRRVTLPLLFINEYLDAFTLPNAPAENQVGDIRILHSQFPPGKSVDLLPLLKIWGRSSFQVELTDGIPSAMKMLCYTYGGWDHLVEGGEVLKLLLTTPAEEETSHQEAEDILIVKISNELGCVWASGKRMPDSLGVMPRLGRTAVYFSSDAWKAGELRCYMR